MLTMEKANVTINRMLQEGRLHELCCVVVDEAHMVSDPQRCGTARRPAATGAQVDSSVRQKPCGTAYASHALAGAWCWSCC